MGEWWGEMDTLQPHLSVRERGRGGGEVGRHGHVAAASRRAKLEDARQNGARLRVAHLRVVLEQPRHEGREEGGQPAARAARARPRCEQPAQRQRRGGAAARECRRRREVGYEQRERLPRRRQLEPPRRRRRARVVRGEPARSIRQHQGGSTVLCRAVRAPREYEGGESSETSGMQRSSWEARLRFRF